MDPDGEGQLSPHETVSLAGRHAEWLLRLAAAPESTHVREDRRLKVLVQASFAESKQRYGSPRIHADLIEQDEQVSRKRVIRLMQEDGLKARTRKRFTLTTMSDHDQPVAANLLDRQFEAAAPNQRWGRGHDRVCHRLERQALSRRRPRPVLAVLWSAGP